MVKFSKKQLSKKQQRNKNKTTRKLKGGNIGFGINSAKAPATAPATWELLTTASDDDGTAAVAATTPAKAPATPAPATWELPTTASDDDGTAAVAATTPADEDAAAPAPATDGGGSSSVLPTEKKCKASNINNKGKGGEVIFNTTSNELTVKPDSGEETSKPTVLICGIKDGAFNLYYGSGSLPIVGGVGNITIPITNDATCKKFIEAILARQQKIAEESQKEILDAINKIIPAHAATV